MTKDVITEKTYSGDLVRPSRQSLAADDTVNDDVTVSTSVSVLANGYLKENLFAVKYVNWMGKNWKVTNTTPEFPRLIFQLGGVWNGPTAGSPSTP